MSDPAPDTFAVFAEVEGHTQPLLMLELPFARLVDEVVKPYEENEPFFLDGVPATKPRIRKLKILRLRQGFGHFFRVLSMHVRSADMPQISVAQYHLRLEALLREYGDDVTAQVVKAYVAKVKPSLKEYLPRREEVLSLAYKFFFDTVKSLGGVP